jgi:hypothetical protein
VSDFEVVGVSAIRLAVILHMLAFVIHQNLRQCFAPIRRQ